MESAESVLLEVMRAHKVLVNTTYKSHGDNSEWNKASVRWTEAIDRAEAFLKEVGHEL